MSQPFDRVRDDVQTIQQAIGLGLPFGRLDMFGNLWVAGCGALVATGAAVAPGVRILVFGPLALAIVGGLWCMSRAHAERVQRPSIWREHRWNVLCIVVLLPCVTAYIMWEKRMGIPREMVGAGAVFFVGMALLLVAVGDRRRRYCLPAAASLMAFGLAVPLLSPAHVVVAAGLCMMVACLASAILQGWQLRQSEHSTR